MSASKGGRSSGRNANANANARPPNQQSLTNFFQRVPQQQYQEQQAMSSRQVHTNEAAGKSSSSSSSSGEDERVSRVVHRTDKEEFELPLSPSPGSSTQRARAFVQYRYSPPRSGTGGDVLDLVHTFVPSTHRGQGLAAVVVKAACQFARQQKLKIRPTCTYIPTFIKQHPQYKDLVEDESNEGQGQSDGSSQKQVKPSENKGTQGRSLLFNAISKRHGASGNHHNTSTPIPTSTAPSYQSSHQQRQSTDNIAWRKRKEHRPDMQPDNNQRRPAQPASNANTASSSSYASVSLSSGPQSTRIAAPHAPTSAATSTAPSTASATPASSVPPGYIPLPFHPIFNKKWTNTLFIIQEIRTKHASTANSAHSSPSTSSAVPASRFPPISLNSFMDVMRRLPNKKTDADLRALTAEYLFKAYLTDPAMRYTYLQRTIPFMLHCIENAQQTFDRTSNNSPSSPSSPSSSSSSTCIDHLRDFPPNCLPILRTQLEQTLHLTKKQIVTLLACSFFGLLPEHNPPPPPPPRGSTNNNHQRGGGVGGGFRDRRFQSGNMDGLFNHAGRHIRHARGTNDTPEEMRTDPGPVIEKIKCILIYFETMRRRVEGAEEGTIVTFQAASNGSNGTTMTPQVRTLSAADRMHLKRILSGIVTFHRRVLHLKRQDVESRMISSSSPSASTRIPLSPSHLDLRSTSTIEDSGYGTLQVDFANRFLGGGVLTRGAVQEEIRLTICTESLIGLMFCEMMEENEAIIIIGAERFTDYDGYSSTFRCIGRHYDATPVDPLLNRLQTALIAIDAIPFRSSSQQFERWTILREVLKAMAGFGVEERVLGVRRADSEEEKKAKAIVERHPNATTYICNADPSPAARTSNSSSSSSSPSSSSHSPSIPGVTDVSFSFNVVSTGLWGCGAFHGEVTLKFLIQLLACALNRRSMCFFTFQDPKAANLADLIQQLRTFDAQVEPLTVRLLYERVVLKYDPRNAAGRTPSQHITDLLEGRQIQTQHQQQRSGFDRMNAVTSRDGAATAATAPTTTAASSMAGQPLESDPISDYLDIDGDSQMDDVGYDSEAERALRESGQMDF